MEWAVRGMTECRVSRDEHPRRTTVRVRRGNATVRLDFAESAEHVQISGWEIGPNADPAERPNQAEVAGAIIQFVPGHFAYAATLNDDIAEMLEAAGFEISPAEDSGDGSGGAACGCPIRFMWRPADRRGQ